MCHSHLENRVDLKYADGTVIVSLLQNNENSHGPIFNDFVELCNVVKFFFFHATDQETFEVSFHTEVLYCVTLVISRIVSKKSDLKEPYILIHTFQRGWDYMKLGDTETKQM